MLVKHCDPEEVDIFDPSFWRSIHCANKMRKNAAYPDWESNADQIRIDANYCLDRAVHSDHDTIFNEQQQRK